MPNQKGFPLCRAKEEDRYMLNPKGGLLCQAREKAFCAEPERSVSEQVYIAVVVLCGGPSRAAPAGGLRPSRVGCAAVRDPGGGLSPPGAVTS